MSNKSETETSGFVDNWQSRKSITSCNLHMLTTEDSCDVSFKVGATQSLVRAHKYVLISRSCVFHSMLCGDLASEGDIMIPDVEEKIFREMLKYLYTGGCDVNEVNVTGLLYLARKYAVGGLEDNCVSFLDKKLNPINACLIMEQAHLFDEKDLQDKALKIILKHGNFCLQQDQFKAVCEECFHKIMRSDSLTIKPGIMFNAAISWANHELIRQGREVTPENTRHMLGESIYSITFTSMEQEEFAQIVVPSGILTSDETTNLFCYFILPKTNIAPFSVKPKKTYNNPLQQLTRISLYDSHVPLIESVDETSIEITCDKNVALFGCVLFGTVTEDNSMYSIKLKSKILQQRHHKYPRYVDVDCKTWDNVKGRPMKSDLCDVKLELPQPYPMVTGVKYCLRVKCLSKGATGYCGQNLRSPINVAGCNISLTLSSSHGLISQMLFNVT